MDEIGPADRDTGHESKAREAALSETTAGKWPTRPRSCPQSPWGEGARLFTRKIRPVQIMEFINSIIFETRNELDSRGKLSAG
jgi:hypothetical protein